MTHTISDHNAAQSEFMQNWDRKWREAQTGSGVPAGLSIDDYTIHNDSPWGMTAVHEDYDGPESPGWMTITGKSVIDIEDQIAEYVEDA